MKNYQVTFYFDSFPYSQSIFIENAIMRERMICIDSCNPFKCVEFLRRGKEVASFYPQENTKFEVKVLDY